MSRRQINTWIGSGRGVDMVRLLLFRLSFFIVSFVQAEKFSPRDWAFIMAN